jgi:hypothetical protein
MNSLTEVTNEHSSRVKEKYVIGGKIIILHSNTHVTHFKFLGCGISYETDYTYSVRRSIWYDKENNETGSKECTKLQFYAMAEIPILLCGSKT